MTRADRGVGAWRRGGRDQRSLGVGVVVVGFTVRESARVTLGRASSGSVFGTIVPCPANRVRVSMVPFPSGGAPR